VAIGNPAGDEATRRAQPLTMMRARIFGGKTGVCILPRTSLLEATRPRALEARVCSLRVARVPDGQSAQSATLKSKNTKQKVTSLSVITLNR
jgi:hypothetical protein